MMKKKKCWPQLKHNEPQKRRESERQKKMKQKVTICFGAYLIHSTWWSNKQIKSITKMKHFTHKHIRASNERILILNIANDYDYIGLIDSDSMNYDSQRKLKNKFTFLFISYFFFYWCFYLGYFLFDLNGQKNEYNALVCHCPSMFNKNFIFFFFWFLSV